MQMKKKLILYLVIALIFSAFFVLLLMGRGSVKKDDLYGEYFEVMGVFGIFPPYACCRFIEIDAAYFYDSRSFYKDFEKSKIIRRNLERKYVYAFNNNVLSFWNPGYERVIRHSFSDKVEGTSLLEYKVIKIGDRVILLGGDNRILVKIDREVKNTNSSINE